MGNGEGGGTLIDAICGHYAPLGEIVRTPYRPDARERAPILWCSNVVNHLDAGALDKLLHQAQPHEVVRTCHQVTQSLPVKRSLPSAG
jgi:hypothetical protein